MRGGDKEVRMRRGEDEERRGGERWGGGGGECGRGESGRGIGREWGLMCVIIGG